VSGSYHTSEPASEIKHHSAARVGARGELQPTVSHNGGGGTDALHHSTGPS